jgi:hypothetical protein
MSQYGDGECPSVQDDEFRRARKPHKCSACGETVTPGRVYHRTFYVYEGDPNVTIRCERCQALYEHLSDKIAKEGDCEEFCDDALNCGHEYEERWEEPPPEAIAALAFWRPGDPLP